MPRLRTYAARSVSARVLQAGPERNVLRRLEAVLEASSVVIVDLVLVLRIGVLAADLPEEGMELVFISVLLEVVEELEEHLAARDDVIGESVVIGRKSVETGETAITAVIYPNPDFSKDRTPEEVEKAVREAVTEVNKSLPAYKHMTKVEIRDTEFEKTTTRKIKRFLVK